MTTRWDWTGLSDTLKTPDVVKAMNGRMRGLAREIHDRFAGVVDPVLHFGAAGDNVRDDSAALNAAIATGLAVDLRGRYYKANNLVQTTDYQSIYSSTGVARITKNAHGDLFTSSGAGFQARNVFFQGDAEPPVYTGDNVVCSGNNAALLNCSSRFAYGRAVKATGGHFQIIGTNDIYETSDTTATGYDIEIGVSGTATLYHHLEGVYTSVPHGGILAIDVGGMHVLGGQIGKYRVQAGTLPAGVGANVAVGTRIIGVVTVEISNTMLVGCALASTAHVTFAAGTSGCYLGIDSVLAAGVTITNNGGADNIVVQRGSVAGSVDYPGNINIPNNTSFMCKTAAGGTGGTLTMSTSDNLGLVNLTSNKGLQLAQAGASGLIQLLVDSVENLRVDKNTTAGNTRLLVYDVDNGTLERVSVGAPGSGGVGFKLLRIPD